MQKRETSKYTLYWSCLCVTGIVELFEIYSTKQPRNHRGRTVSILMSGSHTDDIFFLNTLNIWSLGSEVSLTTTLTEFTDVCFD